jgi:glycosyltransferase involved in cell wall biosynthesis
MPITVLTRQVDLARAALGGRDAEVRSVAPGLMWRELHEGDVGLCLYTDEFSRQATAPTRAAEHLAAGMPIVVTPGIGDLEKLVEDEAIGVVLRGEGEANLAEAVRRLRGIMSDEGTAERCRRVARQRFSLAGRAG